MNNFNCVPDYNLIIDEEIYDTLNDYNASRSLINCSFSILHVYIRSISKNVNSLEVYINILHKKSDVIVCSEAWLICCTGFVNIDGYQYYENNS